MRELICSGKGNQFEIAREKEGENRGGKEGGREGESKKRTERVSNKTLSLGKYLNVSTVNSQRNC